jgi:redox-sensitive bicupin YhaK (pirin superfamily)
VEIGPHPHIGLHTVTWLVAGEILHRDSLGSEQPIRPGQLNLMTAGAGVAHAEEATGTYRGRLHGIQLWVAQPEATRHGPAAFTHHAELPRVELRDATASVIVGEFGGARSPARHDTPLVGAELDLRPGASSWPLRADFEYAVVVLDGAVDVLGSGAGPVLPGHLAYLGLGRDEITFAVAESARLLLLGGEPFQETVFMFWNFVARSHDEVDRAYEQWVNQDDRFAPVASRLQRIPPPPPPPWRRRADEHLRVNDR